MVSSRWRINYSLKEHRRGTWRDRQGLHYFQRFASPCERNGLWGSPFSQATVLLACVHHEALYYLGAAIGTLQGCVLRQNQSKGALLDESTLECAIKQRSHAVQLITATNGLALDPEVVLLACVLFIWFESLQGNAEHLVTHCLQGRSLLRHLERERASTGKGGLVDLDDARGVIIGLELQARCVPGALPVFDDPIVIMREICLPTFDYLQNLEHAYTTLRSAYVLLLDAIRNPKLARRECDLKQWMQARSAKFTPWLAHWRDCFDNVVAASQFSHDALDKQRSNVLKVDYYCITMFATLDLERGKVPWEGYRWQFQAITDLSASVLRANTDCTEPSLSGTQFPLITPGFSVSGPLYTTMARCPDREVAWRAGSLLLAQVANAKKNSIKPLYSNEAQDANETETWTVTKWIQFASESPLDIGMGVCLGGLRHSDDFAESLTGLH